MRLSSSKTFGFNAVDEATSPATNAVDEATSPATNAVDEATNPSIQKQKFVPIQYRQTIKLNRS